MHEIIPQPNNFYEKLEDLLDLLGPEQGRYLRLLRANLTAEERELLLSNDYTIVEVKTIEELLSDPIRNLLLSGQTIQTGKWRGQTRPDLPPKLALVISPDLRQQVMLRDDRDRTNESLRDLWVRSGHYAITLDEANL